MRAAALALLLLVGCEPDPVCDADLLKVGLVKSQNETGAEPAARLAAQALVDSCRADAVPPELLGWARAAAGSGSPDAGAIAPHWSKVCADVPVADALKGDVKSRESTFATCNLGELGTKRAFAVAQGDPVLGYVAYSFLKASEVEAGLAMELGKAIHGGPPFASALDPELQWPVIRNGETGKVPTAVIRADGTVEGSGTVLVADARASVEALQQGLRTLAEPGGTVWIVGGDLTATQLKLSAADRSTPASRVVRAKHGYEIASGGWYEAKARANPGELSPGTEFDLDPSFTVADVLELQGRIQDGVFYVPFDVEPCRPPHAAGMVCVQGGPAIVGGGDEPRREIVLSTFYLDEREVTGADWDACKAKGGCRTRPKASAEQPVVKIPSMNEAGTYWSAVRYCAWAGKRLPTRWELEVAARGRFGERFPWGNEPASCDKANYAGCGGLKTAGPAHRYGLRDIVGNAAEWTSTWAPKKGFEGCGGLCTGRDPIGPCSATYPCGGHDKHVLFGGSHASSDDDVDPVVVRSTPDIDKTGAGMRCASSHHWVGAFPPKVLAEPWEGPATLEAPSDEQVALFNAVPDDDIDDIPFCDGPRGRSGLDCRDGNSYIKPNEDRAHLFREYIRNVGGGYVGVASDQNYSYAAIAKTEWLWLMDYDPAVVRLHKMNKPLIEKGADPQGFVDLFSDANAESSEALVREAWANEPDVDKIVGMYTRFRKPLHEHYKRALKTSVADPGYGWLRNPEHYAWMRMLHQQNRVKAVGGNLLADGALRAIGRQARKMGVPMRIYYTSNAPDAWGGVMTPDYKANITGLPMDHRSVVLQVLGFPTKYGQTGYWHYNIFHGPEFQHRLSLEHYDRHWKLVFDRAPTNDPDLTYNGMPSTDPDQ